MARLLDIDGLIKITFDESEATLNPIKRIILRKVWRELMKASYDFNEYEKNACHDNITVIRCRDCVYSVYNEKQGNLYCEYDFMDRVPSYGYCHRARWKEKNNGKIHQRG